jgi:hypothetical protein
MNLQSLATRPQLQLLKLDSEDIIAEYGEPLEFYIYDRQPVSTFIRLANTGGNDMSAVVETINGMIYTKEGELVVQPGTALPTRLYMQVIEKVITELGK